MKKIILFLASTLALTGCSGNQRTPDHVFEVYKNNSEVSTSEWKIKLDSAYAFMNGENYYAQVTILIKILL